MLNGFLNINKTAGMTSQKVVYSIKKIAKAQGISFDKIGHLGTLDPAGEGVLPIAINRATRLFDYFLDKIKIYYTEFTFGVISDTLDATGTILKSDGALPTIEQIRGVLPSLCGNISQMPPAYSAKAVDGVRAYTLARNGQTPILQPKIVNIISIELLQQLDNSTFSFKITCGGGTYIRSIARDMAEKLGTIALMKYIKRLQSGSFCIDKSITLEELSKRNITDCLMPLDVGLAQFERFDAPAWQRKLIIDGVKVTLVNPPKGYFVLYVDDVLVGIAEVDEENILTIRTRLI